MTPRERFLAAVSHGRPDRVPLDLMGTAGGMVDSLLLAVRQHLGLRGAPRRFRQGEAVSYYDEQLLEALQVDTRRVWLRQVHEPRRRHDGTLQDEWGVLRREAGGHPQPVTPPLAEAGIAGLAGHAWPDATNPARVQGLADEAARLSQETDYAVVARAPCAGFLDIACWLRGTEQFMLDLALDAPFARALISRILEAQLALFDVYLKAVGSHVQMVETVDDLAGNSGPMISPAALREFILPAHRELNALIRSRAPQAAIFLHSDGNLLPIADDLIACGVDVLSPMQPNLPAMPLAEFKQRFGDRLCLHGGIDNLGALRGTAEEVRADVRRCLGELGRGGGYILAPCNHIQADVPPANVVLLMQAAREYGRTV